jgi:hypothetical protein
MKCLTALRLEQSSIPFRESKLTLFLKPILQCASHTMMLVHANGCAADYDETQHVLQYAAKATSVVLPPTNSVVATTAADGDEYDHHGRRRVIPQRDNNTNPADDDRKPATGISNNPSAKPAANNPIRQILNRLSPKRLMSARKRKQKHDGTSIAVVAVAKKSKHGADLVVSGTKTDLTVAVPLPNVTEMRQALRLQARQAQQAELRAAVEAELRANMEAKLRVSLEAELRAALEAELRVSLEAELRDTIEAEIRTEVAQEIAPQFTAMRQQYEAMLEPLRNNDHWSDNQQQERFEQLTRDNQQLARQVEQLTREVQQMARDKEQLARLHATQVQALERTVAAKAEVILNLQSLMRGDDDDDELQDDGDEELDDLQGDDENEVDETSDVEQACEHDGFVVCGNPAETMDCDSDESTVCQKDEAIACNNPAESSDADSDDESTVCKHDGAVVCSNPAETSESESDDDTVVADVAPDANKTRELLDHDDDDSTVVAETNKDINARDSIELDDLESAEKASQEEEVVIVDTAIVATTVAFAEDSIDAGSGASTKAESDDDWSPPTTRRTSRFQSTSDAKRQSAANRQSVTKQSVTKRESAANRKSAAPSRTARAPLYHIFENNYGTSSRSTEEKFEWIVPKKRTKQDDTGVFARPKGRKPKGVDDWDANKGAWRRSMA